MKRISHDTWSTIFGVVYLGLMTNFLVLIAALPLVVLLVTTDPALSWPFIAVAVPLAAPALTAAFATFREYGNGETQVARTFVRSWRRTWRKSMLLALLAAATIVVLLVDVRAVADTAASVVIVPVLGILTLVAGATALTGLVAISEAPHARLRDVAKASLYLSARRWYLTAVTFLVLGMQVALFTSMPAIAVGLTAAPALYIAWANSRYTLRPVLETEVAVA